MSTDTLVEDTNSTPADIKPKKEGLMSQIVSFTATPPTVGDLIEGTVIELVKSRLYIDLAPFGTGIIYGKEFINARDIIRKIRNNDKVTAKVVDVSNEDGYIELSLKEAKQALVWSEIEEAIKAKTVFELPILDANKGGLLLSWQGVQGFLPASQLKAEHYPRVEDGDKDKILEELRKLVNTKIAVSIIGATPKDGKLIFSEKNLEQKDKEKIVGKYKVGDILDGEVGYLFGRLDIST